MIGVVLVIINFIWWYGFAYGLGQAIQKIINIYGACQNGFFIAVLLDLSSCRFLFPFV